ncbi:MAG: CvpA family protein [Lachnospiraceae bacterium]|nr:CvpA family protein [Lachnospiraceae bacterium]
MKKTTIAKIVGVIIALIAAFIYYYITLPAFNLHSIGTWWFLITILVVIGIVISLRTGDVVKSDKLNGIIKEFRPGTGLGVKIVFGIVAVMLVVLAIGTFLSSPVINAKKYRDLMPVEEGNFAQDIKQVDYNTIPLLDKSSASLLGDRKMGSMVEMVSQFEVGGDYTQINYNGRPVRVTPLVYANTIKWFTNMKNGIPAYMMIDMATQDTTCVQLAEGIKYSKSEYFNRNIYRHLRFKYPTYIFGDQLFFEIGDDGTPYWICPVKKFNIGLFGGETVGRVVLCNAVTGVCEDYHIDDVPQWVDKVYQAELLMQLYDYHGTLQHGYFNSILSQKDCLTTTNGYNYIALDDDVWVYSGVTSVNGDQSNVGFVLMNQRTMETKFYKVEGAIEDSAMSSAEGQVQNLGYVATFPLLLNIAEEPTYFIALKDGAGLVKMYAMVNVEKYQWVAIGDTVKECEKAYRELLETNGISSETAGVSEAVSGKIEAMANVVIEGNTHYYIYLEGKEQIYDINLSANEDFATIIKYQPGDTISMNTIPDAGLVSVTSINE